MTAAEPLWRGTIISGRLVPPFTMPEKEAVLAPVSETQVAGELKRWEPQDAPLITDIFAKETL